MKPIVLLIYRNKNLADQFAKHFVLNGYELYQFYDEEIPYLQFSKFQKIQNVFNRLVLKDKNLLHRINEKNFLKHSAYKLKQLKKTGKNFDYCFIIRGDLIPERIVQYARKISTKMLDYQLDGLSVSEKILDYKEYFDQIFVFDEKDVKNYPDFNLKAITNCFFEEENNENPIYDFYYTGALLDGRLESVKKIMKFLGNTFSFNINFGTKKIIENYDSINFLSDQIPYSENLLSTKKSRVLLDFKRKEHDGLSLRFFEAINFRKKIITDNQAVKNYDFYRPENIFVTDYKNFEDLIDFLSQDYKEIEPEIKEKYNFRFWIKNILEDNLV